MQKVMRGTLTQPGADSGSIERRTTGVLQKDFTGIIPAYIRLEMSASVASAITAAAPWYIWITFGGEQSDIKLSWILASTGAGPQLIDCVKEWYVPDIFPPLFDEEFKIRIYSAGTGQANVVNYVMYYDLKKYTELEMVQAIETYPLS